MKLSKREKILLYILACIVIFSGGLYLLILPAFEKQTELTTEIDSYRTIQNEMEIQIQLSDNIQEQIIKANDEITVLSSDLYTMMPNYDIDVIITSMLNKHNLNQSSLLISDPTTSETNDNCIQSKYVNIQITGVISDVSEFINEIDDIQSIHIITFYMDFVENDKINISMSLEVFMYETNDSLQ